MKPNKTVARVGFQLCSSPDSEGLVLEFMDENDDPFMEIRVTKDDAHQVVLYRSDRNTCISLDDLLKGIDIARERVFNLELNVE